MLISPPARDFIRSAKCSIFECTKHHEMKKRGLLLPAVFLPLFIFSQNPQPDTLASPGPDTSALKSPPQIQGESGDSITDFGIAVAPSTLRFRAKPGTTQTQYLTVTNDTRKPEKFRISFADYEMSSKGAILQVPYGRPYEYGLSKWINASPTFIELKPGEAKKVAVTIGIPDSVQAYRSAWCFMMVDQTTEKKYIAPEGERKDNVVMGIIPVFGFQVFIFQNPPNVKLNKVEIKDFHMNYDKDNKYVTIVAKNVGDGIGFCKTYIELNNLNTGKKEKLFIKQFTIFPGMERILDYQVPGSPQKGKYIATAILDFGSDEELEAAEFEFEVK